MKPHAVRMQWTVILAAGLLVAAGAARADQARRGSSEWEGFWTMVSGEQEGNAITEDELVGDRLVITGNRYRVKLGDKLVRGTFKLDPSQTPATIDVTDSNGAYKGKTCLGIYRVEGDTQHVAFAPPGKPRPKDFTTKSGTAHMVHVWKRLQLSESVKRDLERLQGTWRLREAERNDVATPASEARRIRLVIVGNVAMFPEGRPDGTSAESTFEIDPSHSPKQIQATALVGPDKGKTFLGIYDLSNNRTRVCFAPPGKPRPTKYESEAGSGDLLHAWSRGGSLRR